MAGIADLAGAAAGATPWGAAIGAAGSLLGSAMQDAPAPSLTSGAFMGGSLTVGTKNVGAGSASGSTSASASQIPVTESPGATVTAATAAGALNQTTLLILGGAAVVVALIFAFAGRRK